MSSGQPSVENGQSDGAEPRVEDVGILREFCAAAFRALRGNAGGAGVAFDELDARIGGGDHLLAVVAVPDGDAMAPPELARNAPVANVVEPVEQNRALIVGDDLDQAATDSFLGGLGQRLHFHEPLRGDTRLDFGLAAIADADGVRDIFDALEQAERFEIGDDAGARFEAVEPGVLSGSRAHVRVVGHHVNFGEVVAPADLEVVRIVRGRDLDDAGAEFAVHVGVRDHGNFAVPSAAA